MEGVRFSVWPAIPVQYEMVPECLEDAVKEVKYIADELTKFLPTPLPEDDLQYYSDLLRSLETRMDLTQRVFLEVDVRRTISAIAQDIYIEDDTNTYGIKESALALTKYWDQHMRGDSSIENPPFEDRPVAPLKSEGDDDDDDAWTLHLTEEQASRVEREYLDRKKRKKRALSYFRIHTPRPMAWAPVGPDAWNEDQDKIGRGLLHDSPNWKPIYPAWDMAGVPFDWKNPEEPEDDDMTDEEFRALMEQIDRETQERMARRERQEELMKGIRNRRGN